MTALCSARSGTHERDSVQEKQIRAPIYGEQQHPVRAPNTAEQSISSPLPLASMSPGIQAASLTFLGRFSGSGCSFVTLQSAQTALKLPHLIIN